MAKPKSKTRPAGNETFVPWLFATIQENGKAPESRVPNANNAYQICRNLKQKNLPRELKWSSIFRCYNLFPPNSYSNEANKELLGSSNVPFGQMYYRVNNRKSSYFDLVTQRNLAAEVKTKIGNINEKTIWSGLISQGWDRALHDWLSYLYNNELTQQEMVLYGKGFEFADTKDGWPTTSLLNSEVLIPNDTYADLRNLGYLCLKRTYTPLQFWDKIKNEKEARSAGWNFWASVDALRYYTSNNYYFKTPTEFLHSINQGSTVLTQWEETKINLYELYVKEYDGSITKSIQLQNYGPIMNGYNDGRPNRDKLSEDQYRDKAGFLFLKQKWAKQWDELITPFTCSTGSGFWHEIKGYGEGIYTQCRAHDIHMNKMMNAALINNTFLLEGGSADATQKIKRMEWYLGGMQILPQDVKAVQNRFEMPIGETMQLMQYYTAEMDRGTGQYMQNSPNKNGSQRTLGEAQLDAAENTKLQGTELRGYNASQTRWQRQLYRRFINCSRGGEGYDLKEKFMEFMASNEVPEEAYAWENIESLESNLLGGAGSPAYRSIVGEKLVGLSGMVASSPYQENAIQDTIASLTDRQMVGRYRPIKPQELPKEIWEIGMENSALTDENCNPENIRVLPEQNHLEHIKGHFSDAMAIGNKAKQMIQQQADLNDVKGLYGALMFHGGHIMAHMQFLQQDPTKKEEVKMIMKSLQVLQKLTDEIGSAVQQMMQAKQGDPGQASADDQKIHAQVAQAAIKVDTAQKLADIKLGVKATDHEVKMKITKDKAALSQAATLARANQDAEIKSNKSHLDTGITAVSTAQELDFKKQESEIKLAERKKSNAQKTKGQ